MLLPPTATPAARLVQSAYGLLPRPVRLWAAKPHRRRHFEAFAELILEISPLPILMLREAVAREIDEAHKRFDATEVDVP